MNEGMKPAQPVSPLQPDRLIDPAGDSFIVAPSILDPLAPEDGDEDETK